MLTDVCEEVVGCNVRQLSKVDFSSRPDFCIACVLVYDVVKMEFQSFDVRLVHSFENVDDDAREPVFVEIDFLIVRDLADFAAEELLVVCGSKYLDIVAYLTSANVDGSEAVIAPPNSSALMYCVIAERFITPLVQIDGTYCLLLLFHDFCA